MLGGALGAITEILTWVGIGAAVLFGGAALIVRLADGTWEPIRAVLIDDPAPTTHARQVVRWFGEDGVHEAPLTDEMRAAARGDELELFHRVGTRDDVRLHERSPVPRLLGGVALACGAVGVLALVVQIVAMVAAG
ncbi:hypothetical protein [Microbacterium sp. JZ31]|uniref:hypothetical protein n=1 Tax=Microbacterium sp. JZ31 TaxID=1906274 RepID=UPI0019342822|nr:hypothetical protein [Microbacterium sp. JZ31]